MTRWDNIPQRRTAAPCRKYRRQRGRVDKIAETGELGKDGQQDEQALQAAQVERQQFNQGMCSRQIQPDRVAQFKHGDEDRCAVEHTPRLLRRLPTDAAQPCGNTAGERQQKQDMAHTEQGKPSGCGMLDRSKKPMIQDVLSSVWRNGPQKI